jgi:hypothetical protein
MLQITIPAANLFDEITEEFINTKEQTLRLEHSLVSLSKWESKWCKPFLTKQPKTDEETIDYVRCMTITQNVDPEIYKYLTDENIKQVQEYIDAPMSAIRFPDDESGGNGGRRNRITSETIYDWMLTLNIPLDCEKWHLNRLIALIQLRSAKNQPQKPMTAQERAALNMARRKKYNTKG